MFSVSVKNYLNNIFLRYNNDIKYNNIGCFFNKIVARIGGASLIAGMSNIAQKVSELAIKSSNDDELLLSEAPENFLDPIMSTLMIDPVILPSSKMNVDRSTIARYNTDFY